MLSFRPAKRSEAKPLIGLYAESGAGKTLSALLLARGFAGPTGKVGMIETESGRGEAYADDPRVPGGYTIRSLRDDFSPRAFGEALGAAEKEELDALILDSASHEWDAVGGVRHMAAMNEEAGKKGMLVWQTPKMDHQRHFMLPLLSTPIPLVILCMRARYPMEENPTKKGDWKRGEHLVPYQSDTILFEMFAHGWIDRAHKFHGTKWTREELQQVIRDNEPITLETGQRLAAWAKGGSVAPGAAQPSARAPLVGDAGVPFNSAAGAYRNAPGATSPVTTSGGGSGGAYNLGTGELTGPDGKVIHPPAMTPLDEALAGYRRVLSKGDRLSHHASITVGQDALYHHCTASEQKRLVAANIEAARRVG